MSGLRYNFYRVRCPVDALLVASYGVLFKNPRCGRINLIIFRLNL